ncbi:hypothetical protein O6H91_Y499300 [Diphasiastrum complanatum]|nr:hypothetical protein O6H91_Y499300 [Diphasiastrum complanatum]
MGIGGGFWDVLRPIARLEDLSSLRGKKVAIDLSYWMIQQQRAVKGSARNPHLRLTFFRVVNLVARVGALPVFVVDGTPPPLKLRARLDRFSRFSGFCISLPSEDMSSSKTTHSRNDMFTNNIEECVVGGQHKSFVST